MVIGAPDINHLVEPARIFMLMIGNIGCEIGGFAVISDDHAILLITENGAFEPAGAIVLVDKPLTLQRVQKFQNGIVLVEFLLAEIIVKNNAKVLQIGLDTRQYLPRGIVGIVGNIMLLLPQLTACFFLPDAPGDVLNVVSPVTVLRKIRLFAPQLLIAQQHGPA